MGTTSDKLTYLNGTKQAIKESLNLGGANITNEPFREYADKLKDLYIYYMNNGLDVVWENWNKVTGEGITLTLNNTIEAPMKITLKPSELEQATTTGKNLLELSSVYFISGQTKNGITATLRDDGAIILNGTATANTYFNLNRINFGTSSFNSFTGGSSEYIASTNNSSGDARLVYDAGNQFSYINIYSGTTLSNFIVYPMIRSASISDDTYEPYTNGPSPNPDYPQDVHVISGENSVEVNSENLFDQGKYLTETFLTSTYKYAPVNFISKKRLYLGAELKSGKTAIQGLYVAFSTTGNPNSGFSSFVIYGGEVSEKFKDFTGYNDMYISYYPTTYTWEQILEVYNIWVSLDERPYEKFKGQQIYPINLPIENKLNLSTLTPGYVTITGAFNFNDSAQERYSNFIKVKPNTQYTFKIFNSNWSGFNISNWIGIGEYTSNNTSSFIQRDTMTTATQNYYTFTTTATTEYVVLSARGLATATEVQFSEGIYDVYTPYGEELLEYCKIGDYEDLFFKNVVGSEYYDSTLELDKWYLKKKTRKSVINIFQTVTVNNLIAGVFTLPGKIAGRGGGYCNIAQYIVWSSGFIPYTNSVYENQANLVIVGTADDTLETLKSKFDGGLMYYVLNTPTNTLLNSTLQTQLDNLSKAISYQGQTNLSQINNDLPFIINARTLSQLI